MKNPTIPLESMGDKQLLELNINHPCEPNPNDCDMCVELNRRNPMTNLQPTTQTTALTAETLIAQGIEKGISVENMERLLAMRRELKAEFAKAEYDKALAAFQAECPTIKKSKRVSFTSKRTGLTTNYSYAPIEIIVEQVKTLLEKHGFSYSINTKNSEQVTATCKVTHKEGHSETSEFSVPIDKESFMNAQQQVASALTFAKRYAFCNAFGILTGDEDNDAHDIPPTPPKTTVAPKQAITGTVVKPTTKPQGKECKQCAAIHNGQYDLCLSCWKENQNKPK